MPLWEVPIVYKGQVNYIVEAPTAEAASAKAEAQFKGGDSPAPLGNEWETIDHIGEIEEIKKA